MISAETLFKNCNKALRSLVTKTPPRSASYMHTLPFNFTYKESGHCKKHLFKAKRFGPDIHLNRAGAKVYATTLADHLFYLPNKTWAMKPIQSPQWCYFFSHFPQLFISINYSFPPNYVFSSILYFPQFSPIINFPQLSFIFPSNVFSSIIF